MSMIIIEHNCRDLAEQRARLRKKYEAKQKAILAVNAEHDAGIRELQDNCNAARAALLCNLQGGRELFRRPKTVTFHGITVGYEKGRDSITMPDDSILVSRIQTMLPAAMGKTLLIPSFTVIKTALKNLPAETLQRLGIEQTSGADKAIVRAKDDDIETLVQKSLGDGQATPATK